MKLITIPKKSFSLWKKMRMDLYHGLDDDFQQEEMESIIGHADWFCRFIVVDNRIIGFVEISSRNIVDGCLSSPVAYIEGLYLIEEHRGKGVGQAVLCFILQWCRDKGFAELATDAELGNLKAQRFYQAAGFEETDRVVEFRKKVT